MDVWKYEIISRVEQDISFVRFAHSWDILVNTQNKFHISPHHLYTIFKYMHINWNYIIIDWSDAGFELGSKSQFANISGKLRGVTVYVG